MKLGSLLVLTLAIHSMPAHAFDLQGHRGARGLAPENTLPAFEMALKIGVTTLEFDLSVTKDDILVVSHVSRLNPDITRTPDGAFLPSTGPAIRSLNFDELQKFDVGRIRPDTAYAARFRGQQGMDGVRIPALTEVFELVQRRSADQVRFNIETKITPGSGDDTPAPEAFAALLAKAVRGANLASRVSVQSFDWRTLKAMQAIAPEIERVCLTVEAPWENNIRPGKVWTAGLDVADFAGSVPRLVQAAGCAVWSPYYRNVTAALVKDARSLGLKVIPWTVNEMDDLKLMIETGIDGIITDYPDRGRAALPKSVTPPPAIR